MAVSPARRAAFEVLLLVETRSAFSDELLHGSRLLGLDERDRALATEIVLGSLRRRRVLDRMLAQPSKKPPGKLDPEVRVALRMGCYQARFLDRVPERAAVSESVELVKRGPRKSAAGFVNAVLRRLPPRPSRDEELRLSHPDWMVERWRRRFGEETTRKILAAGLAQPPAYLRLNPRFDLQQTLDRLAAEGVETEATEIPAARRLLSGRPETTACRREGRARMQDFSSQLVVPLLGLEPGHRLLDLCAAPGGKTRQALETLGGAGRVTAADLHPHRLREMRRLGAGDASLVALDASRPLPFRSRFDRVLLDAPCSGTGTLARNPEIRWRLAIADIEQLAQRQKAILANALEALRPGGALVYATCSLEREENEDVLQAVLGRGGRWRISESFQRIPGRDPGDGFFACRIEAG